jgi:hypothetical protein
MFNPETQETEHIDNLPDGDILKGLSWGIGLSIPLWLSFFGWVKIIRSIFM